jgi:hypothetical protein
MVDVAMEKVNPVRCESESWPAKARQVTLSRSPVKTSPSRHQQCILYIVFPYSRKRIFLSK